MALTFMSSMIDGMITLTIVVSTTISATPSAMAIRPSHRRARECVDMRKTPNKEKGMLQDRFAHGRDRAGVCRGEAAGAQDEVMPSAAAV
ncbi:hypothetical protein [Streptosporangium sp. NPDC049376]|uniref:hypothetical protein n=1 Tax=Streptosporangium sp. NPDC049376 TaxID=3366192 RepID=UPI0037A5F255